MNSWVGASSFLLGMTLAVTTITEIPCYFYSGSLLNRFGANKVVLHLLGKQASLQILPSALTGPVVLCIHVRMASRSLRLDRGPIARLRWGLPLCETPVSIVFSPTTCY